MREQAPMQQENDIAFGQRGDSGSLYAWSEAVGTSGVTEYLRVVATSALKDGPEVTIRADVFVASRDAEGQLEATAQLVKDVARTICVVSGGGTKSSSDVRD
ncbi:MAG: hypothetical protein JO353_03045 [Phycisphaerae bacterium]|nr:hypothetical protein [Phycisphaerae bacterium]